MMKIEMNSLSSNKKEINRQKKVDEAKIKKENNQIKLKINEMKENFIKKLGISPDSSLPIDFIIQNEVEFLSSRDSALSTSIKEKDKQINEQKKRIMQLSKDLFASHIKFPRNAAVPLPF